jgi:hypothetical protein
VNERYVATSSKGEQVIRTNNPAEAQEWARRLGGRVIDRKPQPVVVAR